MQYTEIGQHPGPRIIQESECPDCFQSSDAGTTTIGVHGSDFEENWQKNVKCIRRKQMSQCQPTMKKEPQGMDLKMFPLFTYVEQRKVEVIKEDSGTFYGLVEQHSCNLQPTRAES